MSPPSKFSTTTRTSGRGWGVRSQPSGPGEASNGPTRRTVEGSRSSTSRNQSSSAAATSSNVQPRRGRGRLRTPQPCGVVGEQRVDRVDEFVDVVTDDPQAWAGRSGDASVVTVGIPQPPGPSLPRTSRHGRQFAVAGRPAHRETAVVGVVVESTRDRHATREPQLVRRLDHLLRRATSSNAADARPTLRPLS